MAFSDLLTQIVKWTSNDVQRRKALVSLSELESRAKLMAPPMDFAAALAQDGFGLVAEIKIKSPSLGMMRQENVQEAPFVYSSHPLVRAVSVLTSERYFGMGIEHLRHHRQAITKPILCKDFILEEYQIAEARCAGADAVLLMAHVLENRQNMKRLLDYCRKLGMEALVETRNKAEIASLPADVRVVGINSRKLDSGSLSIRYAISRLFGHDFSPVRSRFTLVDRLPKGCVRIAESGIDISTIASVKNQGWNAALIGASILRDSRGVKACLDEMKQVLDADLSERRSHGLEPRFA